MPACSQQQQLEQVRLDARTHVGTHEDDVLRQEVQEASSFCFTEKLCQAASSCVSLTGTFEDVRNHVEVKPGSYGVSNARFHHFKSGETPSLYAVLMPIQLS